MRTFGAIAAAFLVACMAPAASRADAPGPASGTAAAPGSAAEGCKCPGAPRRAARPHRPKRHHARHHRRWHPPPPMAVAPALPPAYYNPGIPSPYDTAYDRAMVLHFRSPIVSGLYNPEPGYPPTPPVAGIQHYRVQPGTHVLQYDGLIGEYVQLAADDPSHEFALAAAGHPANPPPPGHPPH